MQSIVRQLFWKTVSVMVCSHNMRESVWVCRKLESQGMFPGTRACRNFGRVKGSIASWRLGFLFLFSHLYFCIYYWSLKRCHLLETRSLILKKKGQMLVLNSRFPTYSGIFFFPWLYWFVKNCVDRQVTEQMLLCTQVKGSTGLSNI